MSSVRPVRSLPITSAVRRANSIVVQVLRVGRLLEADQPDSRRRAVCRAPAAACDGFRSATVSAPSRAILRSSLAGPVQMIRSTPQQPAARAIRERLTLLRIGAQTITSSRGRASGVRRFVALVFEVGHEITDRDRFIVNGS